MGIDPNRSPVGIDPGRPPSLPSLVTVARLLRRERNGAGEVRRSVRAVVVDSSDVLMYVATWLLDMTDLVVRFPAYVMLTSLALELMGSAAAVILHPRPPDPVVPPPSGPSSCPGGPTRDSGEVTGGDVLK